MAEATRFKDILEAQKKAEQLMQTDALKRDATEARLQEQIHGWDSKFDNLTKTLASIQLQLSNMDKGKSHVEEESILGDPPSAQTQGGKYSIYQQVQGSRGSSGQWGNQQVGQFKTSMPKIDFPKFDGNNPRSWFLRCNHYFKMVPSVSEAYRVHMACMNLEGKAALWYQNSNMGDVELDWDQFVSIISARFEDMKGAKVIAEFNKLKQTGSYDEYVEKFEELRACMLLFTDGHYTEEHFMASFVSGVSEDMQAAIDMVEPKTLKQTIEVGRKHLLTMEAMAKRLKVPNKMNNLTQGYKESEIPTADNQKVVPHSYQKAPIRLLTSAEMAARREKGQCFNCDEQFVYGHRCKNIVKCMMMSEQDELNHLKKLGSAIEDYELVEEEPMEEIPISLNAMNGVVGVSILNVGGRAKGNDLNILIDSGSTTSFLQTSTAKKLGCKLYAAKPVWIRVAGGHKLLCDKMVKDLKWIVQGHEFKYSLRVLDDLGCDLILGCDWFNMCSPVEFDFPKRTITVHMGNQKLKLQASDPTTVEGCSFISVPSLSHLVHTEYETEMKDDFYFSKILAAKLVNPTTFPDFKVDQGPIKFKGRLAVGSNAALRASISAEMHDSPHGGILEGIGIEMHDYTHEEVKDFLAARHEVAQIFKENLSLAQTHIKQFSDQRCSDRGFEAGNVVYLKFLLFRQEPFHLQMNLKLSACSYGSYKVVEKEGAVAHKLDLPDLTRIYLVFLVSQLKNCIGEKLIPLLNLPTTDNDGELSVIPTNVRNTRVVTRSQTANPQVLVLWTNSTHVAATGEDEGLIVCKFRSFDPWGQGSFQPRGIVMEKGDLDFKEEVAQEEIRALRMGIEFSF